MKKNLIFLLATLILVSCGTQFTLQKRKYRTGFHFSSNHSSTNNHIKSDKAFEISKKRIIKIETVNSTILQKLEVESQKSNPELTINNSILQNHSIQQNVTKKMDRKVENKLISNNFHHTKKIGQEKFYSSIKSKTPLENAALLLGVIIFNAFFIFITEKFNRLFKRSHEQTRGSKIGFVIFVIIFAILLLGAMM